MPAASGAAMTRYCAACEAVLGEKCSQCGSEAAPINVNAKGHPIAGTDFLCVNATCGHRFAQGDGGNTYGLCDSCKNAALRKAVRR